MDTAFFRAHGRSPGKNPAVELPGLERQGPYRGDQRPGGGALWLRLGWNYRGVGTYRSGGT